MRQDALLVEQADLVECGAHPSPDVLVAVSGDHQRQGHIVEHCAVEQQTVILENHADLAAYVRYPAVCGPRQIFSVEP